MAFWAYMLKCADGHFYVGHSDNLEARLAAHQSGTIRGYPHSRRPVKLIWSESFFSREEALAAERQIKGWSRTKKRALIAGDWDLISELARCRS